MGTWLHSKGSIICCTGSNRPLRGRYREKNAPEFRCTSLWGQKPEIGGRIDGNETTAHLATASNWLPWTRRQRISPKSWYLYTNMHGVVIPTIDIISTPDQTFKHTRPPRNTSFSKKKNKKKTRAPARTHTHTHTM